MKKPTSIRSSFLVLLLIIAGATNGQYTKWEKDVSHHNIPFVKIRFIVKQGDTTYVEGTLSQMTVIEGYPCYKQVVFTKGWKLRQFILAEKFTMLGAEIPKDTEVRMGKENILCSLGGNTEVQGYCCKGNSAKWYSMGISTTFYLNGKLRSFYPCEDVKISNILCKSSPFAGVKLFENGNLKQCKLATAQKVKGKQYKKNTTLTFDETGAVVAAD